MRHFALRLQRPPGGSLRDIRENAEYFLPLRLYHYAIVVLRAVLISHPSRAESFSPLQNLSPVTMTSARFSRADIQEILNNTTISDILPCGYNDLRAVRSATSEKMPSTFFLCGSIPTQSLCSGRCLSAIQVEPSISSKCFKSLPLRKPPARGRGQTWRNTLRPELVISLHSPAPFPKRETAHFVALNRMCRVPDPYSAVALRVSDCLLRSRRSPLRLSFLSEVGFL